MRRLSLLACGAAGLALVLALCKQGERTVDDAYIIFRYADNLRAGHGLVFNPGERVEGYSTLSFVLLVAGAGAIGFGPILASNLLNLGGVALAAWSSFHVGARAARGREAWMPAVTGGLAALLVAFSDGFCSYGLLGLETAFAGGLVALGLLTDAAARASRTTGHALVSGAVLGTLAITRPEGISVYVAIVAGGLFALGPRREATRAVLGLGMPLAQMVFRLAYYGSLVPNTYHAKIWSSWDRYVAGGRYAASFLSALGWPLLLIAVTGAIFVRGSGMARDLGPALLVAVAGLAFGVYSGGDLFPAWRFFVPTLPALAIVLSVCAVALARVSRPGRVVVLGALAFAVVEGGAFSVWRRDAWPPAKIPGRIAANVAALGVPMETVQVRVGRFLARELPRGATLTVGDCGRIPYFSGLRVVDALGLMDPVVARSPGAKDRKLATDYLLARDTDFYLLRLAPLARYPAMGGLRVDNLIARRAAFQASHELLAYFPWNDQSGYFLFARTPRLLAELSSKLGEGVAVGDVRATTIAPAPSREEVREAAAELAERPFQLFPASCGAARRFRLLWPCPGIELRGAGSSLAIVVAAPATLAAAIDASGAEVEVIDGAGERHSIEGRDLLQSIPVSAGTLTIRLARGSQATLIAPMLVASRG
ncbi:MAG: hypothetical protein U0166_27040 [Acidobacteriota bacterium]